MNRKHYIILKGS